MEKTDLKQQFKALYRPPAQPVVDEPAHRSSQRWPCALQLPDAHCVPAAHA